MGLAGGYLSSLLGCHERRLRGRKRLDIGDGPLGYGQAALAALFVGLNEEKPEIRHQPWS